MPNLCLSVCLCLYLQVVNYCGAFFSPLRDCSLLCSYRKCAREALKDVVQYLYEEDGQVAVSTYDIFAAPNLWTH